MWQDLLAAIALVFVIEGILPFLSPESWRRMMLQIAQASDSTMRTMGLISMILGVLVLSLVR